MKNKIFAALLLVFMLTFLFAVPAFAYERIEESSTGYPYDEYDKYNYFVADYGTPKMTENGNDKIFTFSITVSDKKSVILSTDQFILTMKNLPPQEYVTIHERLSGGDRLEAAGYSVSATLPYIYYQGDWENYKKTFIESLQRPGTTIKEGSFMGKKALVEVTDEMNSDFNQNRTRQVSGCYFVYFEDIVIPKGIIVLRIDWNASSYGWIGYTIPGKREEVEARVSEQFEIAKSDVRKLLDQYSGITFETKKIAQVRIFKDKELPDPIKQTENTKASTTAGAVTVAVLSTIVAATIGGALGAAGGATENGAEEQSERSSYKMELYKDFGNKIKYNSDTVYVYAKMIEVTPDGRDIDRPDLTGQIEIFSGSPGLLEVSACVTSGEYMSAGVIAGENATANTNSDAVISFRFTGAGGTFQNNVTFKVVGEAYVSLASEKLFVLATSGRSFELPYELVDFMLEPEEVTVNPMNPDDPFELSLGVNKDNKSIIIASDKAEKKPFSNFCDSFSCEITAKNEKESARTVFYVVMCYEGVLPDFLGKKKEIIGFKDDKGNMVKTLIAFSQGLWSDTDKTLELSVPENLSIEFTDEKGVFEVIGLDQKPNKDYSSITDKVYYDFTAKISFPAQSPIKGLMKISNTVDEKIFEYETEINLIPDLIEYSRKWEEEYQNCLKIINTYLPEHFRDKKIDQLERGLPKLGIEDLKVFRHGCWAIAQRCIMQDKESYLIDSYWYDEAIATAELLVYIGDIAFDVALAPFGGPIAGFLASQVKSAVIDMITLYVEKPSIGFDEIFTFIENRFIQMAGQVDGAFEMPKPKETKKLIAWLACYTLYRVGYHWWFDKDEEDKPIGLKESINRGLLDFAGKGAATVLSAFAGDVAKKKGWDKYSIADADQDFVNEKVQKGAKTALDAGDKLAKKADDAIEYAVATLLDFIEKVKGGSLGF